MFLTPQQVLRIDQKGTRATNGRLLPLNARVRVKAVSPSTGEVRVQVDDDSTPSHGAIAEIPFSAVRTVSRGRPHKDGTPAGEAEPEEAPEAEVEDAPEASADDSEDAEEEQEADEEE